MQYYEIDPLFERQRSYSSPTINGTTNYAGSVRDASPSADGSGRYLIIGEDPLHFPGPIVANSPFDLGVVPGSVGPGTGFSGGNLPNFYRPATFGEVLSFDLAQRPTSTLDTARTNVIASASHQIFGKQLELFGNFLYSNSDYQSFLNAQPLSNGTGVIIPVGRPGLTNPNDPAYISGVNNAIFNPFNYQIDNTTLTGDNRTIVTNRYNQTNPRVFDTTNNLYRFLGGIRSQITPDWTFETAAYYSKYDISFVNSGLVNAGQLNAMIAGTAVDANGQPIGPLDFFAVNPVGTNPGQVTRDQFNTIFGANLRDLSSFQRVFDAKLTGFPFELPGGKIGVSIGGEFRQEGFKVVDSPEIFVGSVPIQNIDVKRDIYSFYGELSIPIVGASDRPDVLELIANEDSG
ncbi:MAG: hypothetical protein ACR2FX_04710 [Chthoniobacterales bacterium]